MTSFLKFINGSKAYLMIDRKETLNRSKVTCLDQNYTFANLLEKEVVFVKKKFLESKFESLKYFVIKNETNSTHECYDLLTYFLDTLIVEEECPDDFEVKSQTLCEKHILDANNTTTQIIHTSYNTMLVVVIITATVVICIIVTLCYIKRRNNNDSNEVSLFLNNLL